MTYRPAIALNVFFDGLGNAAAAEADAAVAATSPSQLKQHFEPQHASLDESRRSDPARTKRTQFFLKNQRVVWTGNAPSSLTQPGREDELRPRWKALSWASERQRTDSTTAAMSYPWTKLKFFD